MLSHIIGNSEEKRLRIARAELLVALRDLVHKDVELMETLSRGECDYCTGRAKDTLDGHEMRCHFATAGEVLFDIRAQGIEGIRSEARKIREALIDLASDDYLMLDETEPCTHCDGDEHTPECPLHNALLTVLKINRESLI